MSYPFNNQEACEEDLVNFAPDSDRKSNKKKEYTQKKKIELIK